MYALNLKASFLLVNTSSFNHTKVVSLKLSHSAWTDNPVCCSGSWAPPSLCPPRVNLMSFHMMNAPRPSHLNFLPVSCCCVLLWMQMES